MEEFPCEETATKLNRSVLTDKLKRRYPKVFLNQPQVIILDFNRRSRNHLSTPYTSSTSGNSLPQHRGAAPIRSLDGWTKATGVTVFRLVEEMDATRSRTDPNRDRAR